MSLFLSYLNNPNTRRYQSLVGRLSDLLDFLQLNITIAKDVHRATRTEEIRASRALRARAFIYQNGHPQNDLAALLNFFNIICIYIIVFMKSWSQGFTKTIKAIICRFSLSNSFFCRCILAILQPHITRKKTLSCIFFLFHHDQNLYNY